jgi:atypical dual specificity phosphatase
MPPGFSWIEPNKVAGLAYPDGPDDLAWLRRNGIQVLISLTESPPPRQWVNDAGLMLVHVPVIDMDAPTDRQFDLVNDTIEKATASGMGVAVHCAAGRGRTGTVLAAYLVKQGKTARQAVADVRTARPGSIETNEQVRAIERYEQRQGERPA